MEDEVDETQVLGQLIDKLIWASGCFSTDELSERWKDSGANEAIANGFKALNQSRAKRGMPPIENYSKP